MNNGHCSNQSLGEVEPHLFCFWLPKRPPGIFSKADVNRAVLLLILGSSRRSVGPSQPSETEATILTESSQKDPASFCRKTTPKKRRRSRHPAQASNQVSDNRRVATDLTLTFPGRPFAPTSKFSGPDGTRTRWDEAASTLLHITSLFLRNLPEVNLKSCICLFGPCFFKKINYRIANNFKTSFMTPSH